MTLNFEMQPATQLQTAHPADWPVALGWQPLAERFFASAQGAALLSFLQARLQAGAVIFPPQPLRALQLTAPDALFSPKASILQMRDLLSAAAMSQDKMLRMPNTGTSSSERQQPKATLAVMMHLR